MKDSDRRALETRGDGELAEVAALLRQRMRDGELGQEQLFAADALGDPVALFLCEHEGADVSVYSLRNFSANELGDDFSKDTWLENLYRLGGNEAQNRAIVSILFALSAFLTPSLQGVAERALDLFETEIFDSEQMTVVFGDAVQQIFDEYRVVPDDVTQLREALSERVDAFLTDGMSEEQRAVFDADFRRFCELRIQEDLVEVYWITKGAIGMQVGTPESLVEPDGFSHLNAELANGRSVIQGASIILRNVRLLQQESYTAAEIQATLEYRTYVLGRIRQAQIADYAALEPYIAQDLVPWLLGLGDPMKDRVAARLAERSTEAAVEVVKGVQDEAQNLLGEE